MLALLFVPWRDLNGRHKSTKMCKKRSERKRRRLAEAEIRESMEMSQLSTSPEDEGHLHALPYLRLRQTPAFPFRPTLAHHCALMAAIEGPPQYKHVAVFASWMGENAGDLAKGGRHATDLGEFFNEGFPGRAGTRMAMRVHFWRRHVRDTIIILEEGNLPHPRCEN